MKGIYFAVGARRTLEGLASVGCVLVLALAAHAQSANSNTTGDAVQQRLTRARTQAVIGNFAAAASELEAIRTETSDASTREVARVMLMGIYLRQSNYVRAEALLNEAYNARSPQDETSTRVYFALTGQMLNGVRTRLDRYREFGFNINGDDLTVEARADLDQLRRVLEKLVEQAKSIRAEKAGTIDAAALIEDASSVRATLANSTQERVQWQREITEARQQLAFSDTRVLVNGETLNASSPASSSSPNGSTTTSDTRRAGQPASNTASSSPTQQRPSVPVETATNNASNPASTPRQAESAPAAANGAGGTTTSDTGAPVAVGSLVEKATQKVSPSYPSTAKSARVSGIVTVFLVVNEKGTVEAVERTAGPALLQQAATDAARRWKFRPHVIDGQPVRVAGFISFNFAL